MKVWHKIVAAPAIAIAFTIALGAVSFVVLTKQNSELDELYNKRFINYQFAAQSAQSMSEVHSNVYRLLTWIANLKDDKIKQISDEQQARVSAVAKKIDEYGKSLTEGTEEQQLAASMVKKLEKYKNDIDTAIGLSTVSVETGVSAMQTADTGFQSLLKDLNELVGVEKKLAEQSYESAVSAFSKMLGTLIGILAVAVAISGVITFVTNRSIVGPLRRAKEVAARIAAGDLTADVRVTSKDETGSCSRH